MPKSKRRKPGSGVDAKGRSTGDRPHVRLYRWELESAAYRSLSLAARALLVELKALFNGTNNGELFLSVRRAAGLLGVGKNLAHRALRELQDRGFTRAKQLGGFDWKDGARKGMATVWILTEFPLHGAPPTKDFMRWQPEPAPSEKRKRWTVPDTGTAGPLHGDTGAENAVKCPAERHAPTLEAESDGAANGHTDNLPSGSGNDDD